MVMIALMSLIKVIDFGRYAVGIYIYIYMYIGWVTIGLS